MFTHSVYVIVYCSIMPHHDKMLSRFEMFNEGMFMVLIYHLFSFSQGYIIDPTRMTQYTMGYSYVVSIGLLVGINLIFIGYKAVKKVKRAQEIKALKRAFLAREEQKRELARIELME